MQTVVRIIAAATALQLLLLPQVSAGSTPSVSAARVTIDPLDLVLNKAGAKLTFAFTPTTQLSSGGTITIEYGPGFYANGITPTMDSCSLPLLSPSFAAIGGTTTKYANSIEIKTSGASIDAGSAFTITIGGLTVGSVSTSSDFLVFTSTDTGGKYAYTGSSPYKSGSRVSQFSMTIANAERAFAGAATVTITFTPSSAISTTTSSFTGGITLFFPRGMFVNADCRNQADS